MRLDAPHSITLLKKSNKEIRSGYTYKQKKKKKPENNTFSGTTVLLTVNTSSRHVIVVFLVKRALNSKPAYSQIPREKGTWERGNRGRSEIPEVLGKFCPSINRRWSLWNFISHKVDSTLCNFYSPTDLSFLSFHSLFNKPVMPLRPNNSTPKFIFPLGRFRHTQGERVSSSNWDLHGISESIKTSHSHQLLANTGQWVEDSPTSAALSF